MNIVLMAGGGGTRLWPLSRRSLPKQFLKLDGDQTLFEQAYSRATQLTSPDNIYVATLKQHAGQIQALLPDLPDARLLLEPELRDTTAAFANVALHLIKAGQGNTPTLFMWCDHIFSNESAFLEDLRKVPKLLATYPNSLVILGHKPLNPETGFGYFEVKDHLPDLQNVYNVNRFIEKPDLKTAKQLVASGKDFWNLGYFSLLPNYLISELKSHNPDLSQIIEQHADKNSKTSYKAFPKISLEYTFVEKTKHILAITGDYGWSDVGNWKAVAQMFGDNIPQGHHVHVDSENNFIYNTTDQAVSLIGLSNTITVITDDAILITDQNSSHQVKEVVKKLDQSGQSQYL